MDVICLEDAAFYTLIEKVVERIREKANSKSDKWISGEEAINKLRITSKTNLQKLKDEGKIRFSPTRKSFYTIVTQLMNTWKRM
jgi:biotin operon repressor